MLRKKSGRITSRALLAGLLGLLFGLMAAGGWLGCSAPSQEPAQSNSQASSQQTPANNETAGSEADKVAPAAQVVVDVDVDCSEAVAFGNELAKSEAPDGKFFVGQVAINEGESALDALRATGLTLVVEELATGPFVDGIQGLTSGATEAMSGWIFSVNGESPAVGIGEVIMQDGDVLEVKFINEF